MTGFEPLAAAAIAGLTGIITEVIKSRGGKLLDQLDRDILKPDTKKALQQYVQNYQERHGTLKVVCVRMDVPIKLDELYTAVQLLNRSDLDYLKSVDALQDWFRGSSRRGFGHSNQIKRPGMVVANQEQYLMVLGGPGIGKSTFLRKVGLEALKSKQGTFQHDCIPVFLALQRFRSQEITVTQLIAKEFEVAGFPEPEEFTHAALDKGKLLILLDGLDEVSTEYLDHAITQIQDLVDRYSQNRFIASCRIAAYKGGFTRFKDVVMAPFDDVQIGQFIHNWFRSEKDQEAQTPDQCWELLQHSEFAAAKELAQTPLLLTLLCAVYDESLSFPKNRAALYGEALDVLLKKWAAEKRIQRDPIYKELSIELERELLADIAYESFESDQLFFNKREVTRRIKAFLINNLNAPKHLDSEKVLEAIEVQQGILVERARNAYSFSHLTFQEYLTAQYIVDNQQIEQIVTAHLVDERWREVFLLIAGLVPGRRGADDLLLLIERQSQSYINTTKLQALLQWAEEATKYSERNYNPVAKQIIAIQLAYQLHHDRELFYFNSNSTPTSIDDLDYDYEPHSNCELFYIGLDSVLSFTRDLECNLDRDPDLYLYLDDALDPALDLSLALNRNTDRGLYCALDRDFYRASEFEKMKIFKASNLASLVSKLEALKSKVPDDDQPHAARKAFADCILNVWFDALNLDPEVAKLSEDEINALNNYLHVNELMLRCKDAAVRVTSMKWIEIEERIFTVRMRDGG